MNKEVKAIIFDLDGTLVDSEPLQYQAFNEAFSRYGHPVSLEEYDQWRGWQVVPPVDRGTWTNPATRVRQRTEKAHL